MRTATLAEVSAGKRLIADGGFTCLIEGEVCEVHEDPARGLYVGCSEGRHYLDGQLNEDDQVVGFSIVEERA